MDDEWSERPDGAASQRSAVGALPPLSSMDEDFIESNRLVPAFTQLPDQARQRDRRIRVPTRAFCGPVVEQDDITRFDGGKGALDDGFGSGILPVPR
ncbi:MAG: hypothetical protein JNL94_17255 [Planctomycetes bacterium]|nr:hypothetical protein [Planctomycetota bacterium]